MSWDRVSTILGAPPNHWKKSETEQIKQIHRCFRNAFRVQPDDDDVEVFDNHEQEFVLEVGGKTMQAKTPRRAKQKRDDEESGEEVDPDLEKEPEKDEEDYLPLDSPLRSQDGDKKVPQNVPFKDYNTFINTCHIDFWRPNFEKASSDPILAETAQSIVFDICNAQSQNALRVKNGNVPLRKKREHITPLALVMHEMKAWATNHLRTADVNKEDTYKDIRKRIKYLDSLTHKEVWGDTAIVFAAGMRSEAHNKLFRVFRAAKESLDKAQAYAFRAYSRRSSREKLGNAGNLLKKVVYSQMRVLSAILTLDKKLESSKTLRLQPTDLLNTLSNQPSVNYRNVADVLLYQLFKNPLVRATMSGEYEKEDVREVLDDLQNWSRNNMFCMLNMDTSNEPEFLMSKSNKIMPQAYEDGMKYLSKALPKEDPSATRPLSMKDQVKMMEKAFESTGAAAEFIKLVMLMAASIQELVPALYAVHQLWVLAGDGGDYTLYDTLRQQVVDVVNHTSKRVNRLQQANKELLKEVGQLCKTKEKAMEAKQLKSGIAKKRPAWVLNYKFIHTDFLDSGKKNFSDTYKQLLELGRDAFKYDLTSDQLDDKVENCKKMIFALTGAVSQETPKEEAKAPPKTNVKETHSVKKVASGEFGQNNAFGDGRSAMSDAQSSGERYNPFGDDDADDSDDY